MHNIFLFIILLTCIHTPGICAHVLPWFIFYLFNLYLPFENKQNLYHPWNLLWPSQYLGTSFPLGHQSFSPYLHSSNATLRHDIEFHSLSFYESILHFKLNYLLLWSQNSILKPSCTTAFLHNFLPSSLTLWGYSHFSNTVFGDQKFQCFRFLIVRGLKFYFSQLIPFLPNQLK